MRTWKVSVSCWVLSDSLDPMDSSLGLWNSPGTNTGMGSHSPLQGIFPTQGSNLGLLHCRQVLYSMSHQHTAWGGKCVMFKGCNPARDEETGVQGGGSVRPWTAPTAGSWGPRGEWGQHRLYKERMADGSGASHTKRTNHAITLPFRIKEKQIGCCL